MIRGGGAILAWARQTVAVEVVAINPGTSVVCGADELILIEHGKITGTLTAGNTGAYVFFEIACPNGNQVWSQTTLYTGSGNAADTPGVVCEFNDPIVLEPGDAIGAFESASMAAGSSGNIYVRRVPKDLALQRLGYLATA